MIERVPDAHDPRLADFVELRERDLVGRQGRFIAEGEVVVRVLLQRSRLRVRAVLAADKLVDRVAPLVPESVPLLVGSTELLSSVVGFPLHRGLLACGERAAPPTLEDLIARAQRLLVLEGIANHDNVGGIFRNAAAFGVDAVLLDDASCDPLYRKAIRVSAGGALIVPFARFSDAGALCDQLAAAGLRSLALTPDPAAQVLTDVAPRLAAQRCALWLGTEGAGLRPETLARCEERLAIPMAAGFDSLNVAVCSGIALYALSRSKQSET